MTMHFDMAEFDKVICCLAVRIQDPKWAIRLFEEESAG